MSPTLLLFDIDGTLLRTGGAGMRAMAEAGRRMFGDDFRWDGIEPSGSLDPIILAEALALNNVAHDPAHHDTFRDHYVELLRVELEISRDGLRVMPGVHDLLSLLRTRVDERGDIVLGMLTGNYAPTAHMKLLAAGINPGWFTITVFGDEAATRPDLVAVALRKFEAARGRPADPRRVIVIGDTIRDVHCAKAHNCVAFAVTTGGSTRDALVAAGPDVIVTDLSDPSPLIQMLDAADSR